MDTKLSMFLVKKTHENLDLHRKRKKKEEEKGGNSEGGEKGEEREGRWPENENPSHKRKIEVHFIFPSFSTAQLQPPVASLEPIL